MKVLTSVEINRMGSNLISPFTAKCLTPVGYDLRVGKKVVFLSRSEEVSLDAKKTVVIPSKERFAVESFEEILLPDDIFAYLFTRISLSWKGLTNLGTKVDPMFRDKLFLIFSNDSDHPYELRYKEKICNVMFFKYDDPAPGIKIRVRPSFLGIPPFPAPIKDPLDEQDLRQRFGFGVFSVMKYLNPKLKDFEKRVLKLEGMWSNVVKIALAGISTIFAGIFLWFLTEVVPRGVVPPDVMLAVVLLFAVFAFGLIVAFPVTGREALKSK